MAIRFFLSYSENKNNPLSLVYPFVYPSVFQSGLIQPYFRCNYHLETGALGFSTRVDLSECTVEEILCSIGHRSPNIRSSTVQYSTVQYSTVQYSSENVRWIIIGPKILRNRPCPLHNSPPPLLHFLLP